MMKLLSVVIADDDHLVLNNLKNLVSWEKLGFQIAATATNGRQALELIRSCRPQLVITDVMMPVMGGLELTGKIREQFPDTKILIISSYDEFEYAKKAIQQGVTDYILKTEITTLSITAKLTAVYSQLTSQIQIAASIRGRELRSFFEDGILPSVPALIDNDRFYYFIIAQTAGFSKDLATLMEYQQRSARFLENSVRSMKEFQLAPICFICRQFCIIGLPAGHNQSDQAFLRNSLIRSLLLHLNSRATHTCVLYSTEVPMTLAKLSAEFHQKEGLLNFYTAFPGETQLSFDRLVQKSLPPVTVFSLQKLSFQAEHFEREILEIKEYLTRQYAAKDLFALLRFYQGFCTHLEIRSSQYLTFSEQKFFLSLEHYLKWLFNSYHECILYLEGSNRREFSACVETAILYIRKEYSNSELNAGMIAASASISTSRLGVLFKEETGKTINEYLTDHRIEQAIYYLSHTSMKIYEICEKCGYKSSQYFSQIFYQKTGKRPIDYRRKSQ